ncbi:YidB family protein [Pantoea sp. C2G6]|uniref:YidB family protein n=1 Tax=Pantoea sp. C2G6 TaxID=3243084 RepID=UPI003ED8882A
MGFLDELVGSLQGSEGHPPGQLQAVWHWVQEQGGIEVLLQKFQQGGLGELFASWIGTGHNQPIAHDEIQSAFGQAELQSLADKLGTDVHGAAGTLATILPQLIDKLSPQGQMDEASLHENKLDLGSMVDQIFKR